jgi:hypothetical protein
MNASKDATSATRARRHLPLIAIVMFGLVLSATLFVAAAEEATRSLRLSNKHPVIGVPLTVEGSGWKPGAVVSLRITGGPEPDRLLAEVSVGPRGSFSASVEIGRKTGGGRRRIIAECVRRCSSRVTRKVYVTAKPTDSPLMFGVFLATLDLDPAAWQRDLIELRNMRANVIQTSIYWTEVEATPGVYDFAEVDRRVRAIVDNGMTVSANVMGSPRHACIDPNLPNDELATCQPSADSMDEFRAFVATTAQRYAGLVDTWQLWDEPNTTFWMPAPDPAAYAELLVAFHEEVHANDPTATVLVGGLPDGYSGDPVHPPAQPYTAAMLEALGGRRPFEGAAIHPFRGLGPRETIPVERADGTIAELTLKEQLVEFAQVYAQAGYGVPDVYVTSIGYNGCDPSREGQATPEEQFDNLGDVYTMALTDPDLSFVKSIYWFNSRDPDPAFAKGDPYFWDFGCMGLMRQDRKWKPAAFAYRALARGFWAVR